MNTRIEIPLSRLKLLLLILGSLMFVVLGALILFNAEAMLTRRYSSPIMLRIVAVVAILFFGAILVSVIKKLFSPDMGLVIDDKGIWDNSNGVSIGLIAWKDIRNIRKSKVMLTSFLLIDVSDPEKYIKQASSKFKASVMRRNMQTYGTPISISSGGLRWSFRKVETAIIREFKRQKQIPFMPPSHSNLN